MHICIGVPCDNCLFVKNQETKKIDNCDCHVTNASTECQYSAKKTKSLFRRVIDLIFG